LIEELTAEQNRTPSTEKEVNFISQSESRLQNILINQKSSLQNIFN